MAIAIGVLPSDLGEDPIEGVRLLEVHKGLLRVCHLRGLLTHQLNDEVLGALSELGVAAVREGSWMVSRASSTHVRKGSSWRNKWR